MIAAFRGQALGRSEIRAFQWDTRVGGYPVVASCFEGGRMTLDLQLESFNRNKLSEDLFKIPSDYTKQ